MAVAYLGFTENEEKVHNLLLCIYFTMSAYIWIHGLKIDWLIDWLFLYVCKESVIHAV